ncbi:hypothetical protein CBOM_07385 [Ceraceosorus bombacis]|uniref:Uncharacterized protein n=1 Tax=Ceraceosorus bombacis TaxID=401625 RepID=A0A0P1BA59_9BASI|nr:hypothetical protein CBOM_07385 [Ceraceosorus bombacis]
MTYCRKFNGPSSNHACKPLAAQPRQLSLAEPHRHRTFSTFAPAWRAPNTRRAIVVNPSSYIRS